MTDTTASNPVPESQADTARTPGAGAAQADEPTANPWQVVTFPGQMPIAENLATPLEASDPVPPSSSTAAPKSSLPDTAELIQLIQDLNHCNDALLLRVADLEESLERSQAALQAEVERNQAGSPAPTATPQAPVVPQQIAQLLTELEIANDGLRRATIHNETLQAEMESSQQRVAQLERECTLLQQRFSEKSTALQQAEASCSDLKARLQRQQRYTLQFKTALEKYLSMTGESSPAGSAFTAPVTESAQPVGMPKAPEIQPWSTAEAAAQGGNLTNLLNGLKGNRPVGSASSPAPSPAMSVPAMSIEMSPAEYVPWNPTTIEPPAAITPVPVVNAHSVETPQPTPEHQPPAADLWPTAMEPESAAEFTEPSPWGAPLNQPVTVPEPAVEMPPEETVSDAAVQAMPSIEDCHRAESTSKVEGFAPPESLVAAASSTAPTPLPKSEATSLPAYLKPEVEAVPAPKVYPSRTPKKIGSLAAVQLPSFGRSPRRSS